MVEFFLFFVVVAAGAGGLATVLPRFSREEQPYLWAGLAAHVVGVVAQVLIIRYVYGYGDMLGFYKIGVQLAEWMQNDFLVRGPKVVGLLFQQGSIDLPAAVWGVGRTTGSIQAVAGFTCLLFGGSLYAVCMCVSLVAYAGQMFIYRGFRELFRPKFRKRLLVAVFLVPTVVFWSSSLMKETVAIGGVGLLFYGTQRVVRGEYRPRNFLLGAVGCLAIALVKPYILLPYFVAAGLWLYWHRSLTVRGKVGLLARPVYVVVAAALAVGSVVGVGEVFPKYSPAEVSESVTETRRAYIGRQGGSGVRVGRTEEAGFAGQLALVPQAVVNTFLRPFLFEAHNPMALANALENTAIIGLILWVLLGRGPFATYRTLVGSPTAIFCVVFALLLGLGIGLTTLNLGSISRYRTPMMPFWVGVLLLLAPEPRRR